MISIVAENARKALLLGVLVGGVSMLSYATETTVGPAVEKAKLETVKVDINSVEAMVLANMLNKTSIKTTVELSATTIAFLKATGKTFTNPVSRYITPDGTYENTEHGDGCSSGQYYCGFTFDADEMLEDVAKQIAEDNYQSVNDGDEVDGVIIHKRPDLVWEPN